MWALKNGTPYAAERVWVRDKRGVHHWIVVVKATYDIDEQGALKLAVKQLPPVRAAEYMGEPGKSSVRYEAELCAMKPTTEVTVIGHAYAPGGRPVQSLAVSLRVAELEKSIVVHGNSFFERGLTGVAAGRPSPFLQKKISYEHAYGGTDHTHAEPGKHAYDSRNPIGCGFAVQSQSLVGKPVPSITYPQGDVAKMGPAGLGAIPSYWTPRLGYGGSYDSRWEATKKPLLPDDYDDRFTMGAPADQCLSSYLRGGEPVELVHMTPTGVLRFELPKVFLTFATRFGRRVEEHRSRLVSTVIEPDDARVSVVWQTSLKVTCNDVDYLDETTIGEKPYLLS